MINPVAKPNNGRLADVREGHARLREILRRVQGVEEQDALAERLAELERYLVAHFASEQADDGLFDTVARIAPQRRHAVDDLRAAHQVLLASVRRLREQVGQGSRRPAPDLRGQVDDLVMELGRHEDVEDELLAEALENDLAAVD